MHQGCRPIYSARCGPRRALILGEDQATTHWSYLILRDFYLRRLCESQTPEKTGPIDASAFRRAIRPVRVLLFGVTTLRITCNNTWARRKALKSRQRAILVDLKAEPLTSVNIFEEFDISTPRVHAPRLLASL